MKKNNRIFIGRITRILISTGLALCLLSIAIPPGVGLAQKKVKPEWVMPKHYPDGFDGMGRIMRITEDRDEIVIDEKKFRLSPSVKYHTPTAKNVSEYLFGPDTFIGYIVDSEHRIISIWLIEKQ